MAPGSQLTDDILREDLAGLAAREAALVLPPPRGDGEDVTPDLVRWLKDNAHPDYVDEIVAGVEARTAFGVQKYKRPLRTGDGRPTHTETWQELLDALQYGHKAAMECEDIASPLMVETLDMLILKIRPRRLMSLRVQELARAVILVAMGVVVGVLL